MLILKNKLYINNFLISKYNYKSLLSIPVILSLNFNVIFYYRQRIEYLIFLNLLLLVFFFHSQIKTRFYCAHIEAPYNVLQIRLRTEQSILKFIQNFIYVSLPFIDSFILEGRIQYNLTFVKLNFFKFPLVYELNIFFSAFDYIHIYLNAFKFQLEFHFKKKKKLLVNYNLLQLLKLPISLK